MSRIAALVALIFVTLPLAAQKAAPRLEVRTATGQTTFHIGERIPLVLSFTGPDGTDIVLYNFGREDPLRLDSFTITPSAAWTDSLATYAAFASGMCCGAKQAGKLSSKPITLEMDLNEWARFDEPGTYTITITSYRTSKTSFDPFNPDRNGFSSNPLQIHIVPASAAWQKATLDRTLHTLAIPRDPNSETSPQRSAAIADLRYLGSPAAIRALASNLRDEQYDISENAFLGLVGLPHNLRDEALTALNKLIDDPTFPVSQQFLQVFPWLQMDEQLPTAETLDARRDAYFAHEAAMQPFIDAAWEVTAAQLPRKQGAARAVTAQTLADMAPLHPSAGVSEEIGAALRASLPTLSVANQATLLSDQWDLLRSRSLLPYLRATAKRVPVQGETFDFYPENSLGALALARWYEFEPDNALAEIRRQIGVSNPTLSASSLDFLPPQTTFPQFESLWAKGFAEGENSHAYDPVASLLIRFGTGNASARLTPLITQHPSDYDCNRPIEAQAYLVKFSPETAKRFLMPASPPPPSKDVDCLVDQISSIGQFVQAPILTEAALRVLKTGDDAEVEDALVYLERFGDEDVRKPILDRYLQWSEHQSTQPQVTATAETPENTASEPGRQQSEGSHLGYALAGALLANQVWIPEPELIDTVQQHCTIKETCDWVKQLVTAGLNVNVTIPRNQFSLHIGQFNPATMELLEAKLDQFPKGTVFTLDPTATSHQSAQKRFEASLPALFTKHGMTLTLAGKSH